MPLYRIEFIGAVEIEANSQEGAENLFECLKFPKGVEIGHWETTKTKMTTKDEEFIGILEECYLSGKDAMLSFTTGESLIIKHNAIPDVYAMYVRE